MSKTLTYISLFSSAGIGCYGFKENKFECIATNEILTKRLKIQLYNKKCRYETGYIAGDISLPSIKKKLNDEIRLWQQKHSIKEPDVIIATPPCQGMSVANHKKGDEKGRNSLVVESIKITRDVMPKFFVFENVRAFLSTTCTDIDGEDKTIEEAIKLNLGGYYNILSRIVNFKEYGSQSSRTRTLVIGVRKDIEDITPFDIFPINNKAKTLKNLIGDLPSLKTMGEISDDIFHSYREFDTRMLPWIENLSEGQSAFENSDEDRIPHRIVDGERVFNKSKNGDKYARWYWDKEGPCIHTRNDILASQNTVHPTDNRVFSIRELMRMMSIPEDFKWSNKSTEELNSMSELEKRSFLKSDELNIRHCLGEAVPTGVFSSIAKNIIKALKYKKLTKSEVNKIIDESDLSDIDKLLQYIDLNKNELSLQNLMLIAEFANSKRQSTAAYFTRKDIAYTVIKDLPDFKKKKIKIIEPSVGVGNFVPLIIEKYKDKEEVHLDLCDIDSNSIKVLKKFLEIINPPKNFKIRIKNVDFLLWQSSLKYDLAVGNPPYGKVTKDKELLSRYKLGVTNRDTNNIFSFFIEKSLRLASYCALIIPKSLLNAPEFNKTRQLLDKHELEKICDYGEKGFKGVKIETISIFINTNIKVKSNNIFIESYIRKDYTKKSKDYVFSEDFPYWLIYRDSYFDEVASKMNLDIFLSFRDRQITKGLTKDKGDIRVLKSRNIGNNEVRSQENYDQYIDEINHLAVAKFYNMDNVVMLPNLTYNPRATFLPKNTIVDGSVALLTLKNGSRLPTTKDLEYYSTKDFEEYYKVARNFGTRSLNIDNNSVFFFGLLKDKQNNE